MAVTKTELTRLVRVARSFPTLYVGPGQREFYCPVNAEAKHKAHDRTVAHRFTVHVKSWEDPTRVAAVTRALADHLKDAEINGEPCDKDIS